MTVVRSLALVKAENELRRADSLQALDDAWSDWVDFPDESDELEYLLSIYRERSEVFAVEAARVLLAG